MDNKKQKQNHIQITGAREHNLKNIDVTIPKDTLTIITGPSGSGKSSLALDILYTEGKRRYMESLSSYARQFLGIPKKPDVDAIEGLCPSIAIEQKTVGHNPRSTVGTITELYDYLRVLYARIGIPHCPNCRSRIKAESPEEITNMIIKRFYNQTVSFTAPIAHQSKGTFQKELLELFKKGYYHFLINGQRFRFQSEQEIQNLPLAKTSKHSIDVIIDTIDVNDDETARINEGINISFTLTQGTCKLIVGDNAHLFSNSQVCVTCSESIPELEPRLFSFNSPIGACSDCHGLGSIHLWSWNNEKDSWKEKYPDFFADKYATTVSCKSCHGKRLNKYALAITIANRDIFSVSDLSIKELILFFQNLELSETERTIAHALIKEITNRLQFLYNVGLSYLSLNRSARTLSGGEGQRIRLATQIGSALSGVLYVLDEPSIGLHQRDNDKLIDTLKALRDQGNTVVVVEHDIDTIKQSDYVIDMGPAAGILGGQVTATGTPEEIAQNSNSLTGAYISNKKQIAVPKYHRKATDFFTIEDATKNNLKNITVSFPLGVLCGVSGVSGSGKSSLIMQELVPALTQIVNTRRYKSNDSIENMVVIDQSPIGRTPRSNPATYLGVFDDIRSLFASLPESKTRGYTVGRFSFNVPAGRCFECNGDGTIEITMHFLPEVIMPCKSCKGKRYNSETLQIKYKDKNIAEILEMTAYEAVTFFNAHKQIVKRLQLLCDVGLDYLKIGQSSTTLSGGEAQRIKLVNELAKRGKNTMYILDEPTTGLHSHDIAKLLEVLNTLVDKGNSIIIIEHNLDLLKTVDWLIDLGPEGGDAGGMIIAQGTPQQVASCPTSHTGKYLKRIFEELID